MGVATGVDGITVIVFSPQPLVLVIQPNARQVIGNNILLAHFTLADDVRKGHHMVVDNAHQSGSVIVSAVDEGKVGCLSRLVSIVAEDQVRRLCREVTLVNPSVNEVSVRSHAHGSTKRLSGPAVAGIDRRLVGHPSKGLGIVGIVLEIAIEHIIAQTGGTRRQNGRFPDLDRAITRVAVIGEVMVTGSESPDIAGLRAVSVIENDIERSGLL